MLFLPCSLFCFATGCLGHIFQDPSQSLPEQWQKRYGNAVYDRDLVDGNGGIFLDESLCFEEGLGGYGLFGTMFLNFWASAPGTCFNLSIFETNGGITVEKFRFGEIKAQRPGLNKARIDLNLNHEIVRVGACFAWTSAPGQKCQLKFSQDPEGRTRRMGPESCSADENGSCRCENQHVHARRIHRAYAINIIVTQFDDEAKTALELTEWDPFLFAVTQVAWQHEAVNKKTLALTKRLQEYPHGFLASFTDAAELPYIKALLSTKEIDEKTKLIADRVHAILAFCVASLAFAISESKYDPGDVMIMRDFLMRHVYSRWASDFALPELRGFGLGFYDVAALLHFLDTPAYRTIRPELHTAGPLLAENLLMEARLAGDVPPAHPLMSSYPALTCLRPFDMRVYSHTHGEAFARRKVRRGGLQVAIVEAHEVAYQDNEALFQLVSLDIFDQPASIEALWLEVSGVGYIWHGKARPEGAYHYNISQSRNSAKYIQTIEEGMKAVGHSLQTDTFLQKADLVAGCYPSWFCVLLHHMRPELPIIFRQNLGFYEGYEAWQEVTSYWPLVANFVSSPRVAMSMNHRLGAEHIHEQLGVRPEYSPLLAFQLSNDVTYSPQRTEALVYKCSHMGFPQLLELWRKESADAKFELEFLDELRRKTGKLVPYESIVEYFAVVMFPHVPNSMTFADLYAMSMPIFLPAEPQIYTWMWSQSDPFGGPGFPEKRTIMPQRFRFRLPAMPTHAAPPHPYPAFAHLEHSFNLETWLDKAYWYQFSEYAMLPHTQRFRSGAHLFQQLMELSNGDAMQISKRMTQVHATRKQEVLRWMSCTVHTLLADDIAKEFRDEVKPESSRGKQRDAL